MPRTVTDLISYSVSFHDAITLISVATSRHDQLTNLCEARSPERDVLIVIYHSFSTPINIMSRRRKAKDRPLLQAADFTNKFCVKIWSSDVMIGLVMLIDTFMMVVRRCEGVSVG
uniref:Uncharacterized protein n=1 Tax=Skeletonema marinoi TaxID=267567 RepID=A0A7S2PD39_9STRA|mmetsp:Transcript_18292/g.30971  ORF Transcript_18292/g.30971 Transcript_18292/m.30971 type:complete len:115 (+) Transcript_18292:89-433(+)